jgi:hypothetical protein
VSISRTLSTFDLLNSPIGTPSRLSNRPRDRCRTKANIDQLKPGHVATTEPNAQLKDRQHRAPVVLPVGGRVSDSPTTTPLPRSALSFIASSTPAARDTPR